MEQTNIRRRRNFARLAFADHVDRLVARLGKTEGAGNRLAMAHWLGLLESMAKKQKTDAKKTTAAFLKPVQPDDSLAAIVGSTPLPRTELTKKLWEYIREHKLQDPKEKRNINADDKMKAVFNGKMKVSMFEMTKLVNEHLL